MQYGYFDDENREYVITIQSGCCQLLVNGKPVEGNYIPYELMTETTYIELIMS